MTGFHTELSLRAVTFNTCYSCAHLMLWVIKVESVRSYYKSFVICYGRTAASRRNDSPVIVSDYAICATPRPEIVPNTGTISPEFLSLVVNPGN